MNNRNLTKLMIENGSLLPSSTIDALETALVLVRNKLSTEGCARHTGDSKYDLVKHQQGIIK